MSTHSPDPEDHASSPTVTKLVQAGFWLAKAHHSELHARWLRISYGVGSLLPESLLLSSLQRTGELDLVLRSMENDHSKPIPSRGVGDITLQLSLSELWVGALYEIFRLLLDRKLLPEAEKSTRIAHQLRLLRIPIEKHELAMEGKLSAPLELAKQPHASGTSNFYKYSKGDPLRAHIMPTGISASGSIMWHATEISAETRSYWIERRALSDESMALWDSI